MPRLVPHERAAIRPIRVRRLVRRAFLAFAAAFVFGSPPTGADEAASETGEKPRAAALESGRAVGDDVPQFYSRVVSGPLMNRSVCFVCQYGQRPVVMVLMRKIGPETRPLLKNIDRLVEQHRAGGLRSFGVLVADQTFPAISQVQTFAFNNHVAMPLTVGTEAVGAESCQSLAADAAVTVVFYHKRQVVERFAFRADELTVEGYTPVIEALKKFAAQRAARPLPAEEAEAAE